MLFPIEKISMIQIIKLMRKIGAKKKAIDIKILLK